MPTSLFWRRAVAAWTIVLAMATAIAAEDFRVSLSVSPFTEFMFQRGVTFTDGMREAKNTEELQRMFVAHGATEVYARIGTRRKFTPGNGDHGLERGLERARMAKSLGLPFNPEIGLFASYGDIRYQPSPDFSDYPELEVPGEWTDLTLDQMLPILRDYGAIVAREILDTGVTVNVWDLGNEVEFGVAGVAVRPNREDEEAFGYRAPDAVDPAIGEMSIRKLSRMPEAEQIAWFKEHLWPANAKMFAAVAEGIRSVDPNARFSTHISGVAAKRPRFSVAYFTALKENGYFPDELGFSFYPTSGDNPPDRFELFKETVTAVHRALGRPIFMAEYSYPAGKMSGIFAWNSPVEGYPQTAEGQANFTREVVKWGIESGILSGIRPWAPDLVGGWGPMSFFELEGNVATARPVIDSIAEGMKAARKTDEQ